MVIDDSEAIRKSVGYTLELGGFEVIEAGNGKEGLQKLVENDIALVLCDVNMPQMDGIEFLQVIKTDAAYKNFRFTPVLMVTTEAGKDKKEEGKALGAKAWIVKPFKPDQLIKSVNMLLS